MLHRLVEANVLAPKARVIATVGGGVHINPWARADVAMLEKPTVHAARFKPARASPSTKVMLTLMGQEFVRRAAGTPLKK